MKNLRFFFILLIGAALLFGFHEHTSDAASAEEMVREFNAKFQKNPAQMTREQTTDDYMFINGEGAFASKEQMSEVGNHWGITKWDLQDLKVQVLGNVYVATGVNHHIMESKENENTMEFRTAFTYVYHEKDGALKWASAQHTHVPKAEDE